MTTILESELQNISRTRQQHNIKRSGLNGRVGIYTDSNAGYKKLAKLSRLCGQREASEVPELQKFPTCEKVICHAMSHYYMLPVSG